MEMLIWSRAHMLPYSQLYFLFSIRCTVSWAHVVTIDLQQSSVLTLVGPSLWRKKCLASALLHYELCIGIDFWTCRQTDLAHRELDRIKLLAFNAFTSDACSTWCTSHCSSVEYTPSSNLNTHISDEDIMCSCARESKRHPLLYITIKHYY
jgi:hypothetical protein